MIQYIIAAGIGVFLGSRSKKSKKSYADGGLIVSWFDKDINYQSKRFDTKKMEDAKRFFHQKQSEYLKPTLTTYDNDVILDSTYAKGGKMFVPQGREILYQDENVALQHNKVTDHYSMINPDTGVYMAKGGKTDDLGNPTEPKILEKMEIFIKNEIPKLDRGRFFTDGMQRKEAKKRFYQRFEYGAYNPKFSFDFFAKGGKVEDGNSTAIPITGSLEGVDVKKVFEEGSAYHDFHEYTREEKDAIKKSEGSESDAYNAITLPKNFPWQTAEIISSVDPFEFITESTGWLVENGYDPKKYALWVHPKFGKNPKLLTNLITQNDESYFDVVFLVEISKDQKEYLERSNPFRSSYYAKGGEVSSVVNNLQKGDLLKIKFGSIASRDNEVSLKVRSRNKIRNGRIDKITFENVNNPDGARFYAYERGNGVFSFAMGDLAISNIEIVSDYAKGGVTEHGLQKGDKLKIKLKNGKEFDLTFDSYGRQKGMAWGKFDGDTKPFSLDTIKDIFWTNKAVVKPKKGEKIIVDLDKGERFADFAKGGKTLPRPAKDFIAYVIDMDGNATLKYSKTFQGANRMMKNLMKKIQDVSTHGISKYDPFYGTRVGKMFFEPIKGFAKGGKTNWVQDVVDSPDFRKGAFTKKAKERGLTPEEFMSKVLKNPDKYDERTRKQAQFMKNITD